MRLLRQLLRFILKYSKRYIPFILSAFAISLIGSIIYVYSSIIVKRAIEAINIEKNFSVFLKLILLFFLLNILVKLLALISSFLVNFYKRNLIKDMQISLFQQVMNIKLSDFSKRQLSDYVSRITYDTPSISSVLPDGLLDMLKNTAILLGSFYIIGTFDIFSSIFAIISVILIAGISIIGGNKTEQYNRQLRIQLSRVMSSLLDPLYNMPIVKAYNIQNRLSRLLNEVLNTTIKTQIKMALLRTGINNANGSLILIMTTGLLLRAGYLHVVSHTFSIGMMFAILYLSSLITQSIASIMGGIINLKTAIPSFIRINEILRLEVEDITKGKTGKGYDIIIKNLKFKYSKDNPVLTGINTVISYGEKIGIVGRSGAGKSTLVKILLGFYRDYSGTVYIGNTELREIQLKYLREIITYIPQEDFIFPGSIRDNMTIIKPNATEDEIIEALKIAGLYNRIKSLPRNIDTEITNAKFLLSGGERQRLSIARAFLKKGEIFIFDEALGQIDSITEREIFESVRKIAKNKTLIVIAHRISTVAKLDRIIVMDTGKIIAEGPHNSLIKENEFYKNLCELQLIKR